MWLQQLNNYQKMAGILFLLSKIINIIATILVFAILASKDFMWPAGIAIILGGMLLFASMLAALYSYLNVDNQPSTEKVAN